MKNLISIQGNKTQIVYLINTILSNINTSVRVSEVDDTNTITSECKVISNNLVVLSDFIDKSRNLLSDEELETLSSMDQNVRTNSSPGVHFNEVVELSESQWLVTFGVLG